MPDLPVVSTQPVLGYRLRWPWFRNDVYSAPGFSLDASTRPPLPRLLVRRHEEDVRAV